jgi:hypothetical protein
VDGEGSRRLAVAAHRKTQAQQFVHDLLERPSRTAHLGFEPFRHILIERHRCSHIMMLATNHHDVHAAGKHSKHRLRDLSEQLILSVSDTTALRFQVSLEPLSKRPDRRDRLIVREMQG